MQAAFMNPFDNGFTMIMSTINTLLNKEKPKLTKGIQLWDYLYSEDAARALRLMSIKGKAGAVYCVGSGRAFPLIEHIGKLRDEIDPELELGTGEIEYKYNQVMHLEADISSLTKDTGFIPQVSFEEGIKKTIEWCKKTKYFQ